MESLTMYIFLFAGHFDITVLRDLGHKMLFDQIQMIMARVETQNWYLKTLMADAFLLLIQRKFEIFWDVSPHFFSDCQGLLF